MKFVEVKEVPEVRCRKNLQGYLNEFMAWNIKVAKVEFNEKEYKNARSAQASFHKAIKTSKLPLTIIKRNDEIFLVRNDM